MRMTEWFLAELEREAVRSRRVLEQAPEGKRDWKPHERSMAFGYLSELVAMIPSWVAYAITQDELDIGQREHLRHQAADGRGDLEPQLVEHFLDHLAAEQFRGEGPDDFEQVGP